MGQSDPGDDHVEHGLRLAIIVAGVSIAAAMQFLDLSIVNVALRTIGGNLGATFDEIGWVVTAYSLADVTALGDRRNAFWDNALASGVTWRNLAVRQLSQHFNLHALLVRIAGNVMAQASVLAYRDLVLLLVVPPLLAIPITLMTRRTTASSVT